MVLHSSRASVQRSFVSFPESTSISLVAVGRYLRYNHANDANIFQSERKIVRKCSDKRVLKEKKKTHCDESNITSCCFQRDFKAQGGNYSRFWMNDWEIQNLEKYEACCFLSKSRGKDTTQVFVSRRNCNADCKNRKKEHKWVLILGKIRI